MFTCGSIVSEQAFYKATASSPHRPPSDLRVRPSHLMVLCLSVALQCCLLACSCAGLLLSSSTSLCGRCRGMLHSLICTSRSALRDVCWDTASLCVSHNENGLRQLGIAIFDTAGSTRAVRNLTRSFWWNKATNARADRVCKVLWAR